MNFICLFLFGGLITFTVAANYGLAGDVISSLIHLTEIQIESFREHVIVQIPDRITPVR